MDALFEGVTGDGSMSHAADVCEVYEKSTIAMMYFKKTICNYPFLDNRISDNWKKL